MQNVVAINQKSRINWDTIIPVAIFHILAIWALFTFSWANLLAAAILWWISGSWGVGLGFHRLLTHRGFQTSRGLERFLTFCGSLSMQGNPIAWVTTHRIHHAFTETEKDPHSPRKGTYWAHMGWIFRGTGQSHSEATIRRYVPDMLKDNFHVVLSRYFYVPTIITGLILFAIGGWSMVLWGVFFRIVWGWHSTWLVNSATHLWGKRRFETTDDSRNNGLIAAITFGEGWHNNHHAYPRSARHGLAWYEIDANWLQISLLEKLGLAKNVYAYNFEKEEATVESLRKAV